MFSASSTAVPSAVPSARSPSPELLATLVFAAIGLAAFFIAGVAGWPGAPSTCLADATCYCEAISQGIVRQPANTWSNLATLPVACAVAMDASRLRRGEAPLLRPAATRPRRKLPWLGLGFAMVLVAQGLGSMYFHGGLTEWAAYVDAASMFAVASLVLATNLARLGRVGVAGTVVVFVVLLGAGVLYRQFVFTETAPLIAVLFVAIVATEAARQRARRRRGLGHGWAVAMLGVFVAGAVAWALSARVGQPLCEPSATWQPHALWHLTSACAVGLAWINAREDLLSGCRRGLVPRRGG